MPMGIVSAITAKAPGSDRARQTPPPAISASAIVTARMAPTRAASGAAGGANTPMPITGMAREQRRHRVADAERVLRARQHRAEPDELRAQRQRRERDRDEQCRCGPAAPRRDAHRSS